MKIEILRTFWDVISVKIPPRIRLLLGWEIIRFMMNTTKRKYQKADFLHV
jgi:hypothetical protein